MHFMTHGSLRIRFYLQTIKLHSIDAEHFIDSLSSKGVSQVNNERFKVCKFWEKPIFSDL